jgi:hypothetical protein
MEFSEQYLTYEEYRSLGGTLDLTPFNLLEFEARKKIDLRTQNRLKNVEEIPQEVKLCIYNLINTIQTYSNKKNRNIQSESVGEYSVSYGGNIQELIQSKNSELNDIILNDLYGVIVNGEHVIYDGVKQ